MPVCVCQPVPCLRWGEACIAASAFLAAYRQLQVPTCIGRECVSACRRGLSTASGMPQVPFACVACELHVSLSLLAFLPEGGCTLTYVASMPPWRLAALAGAGCVGACVGSSFGDSITGVERCHRQPVVLCA